MYLLATSYVLDTRVSLITTTFLAFIFLQGLIQTIIPLDSDPTMLGIFDMVIFTLKCFFLNEGYRSIPLDLASLTCSYRIKEDCLISEYVLHEASYALTSQRKEVNKFWQERKHGKNRIYLFLSNLVFRA